jgi:sulfotransferase family protein
VSHPSQAKPTRPPLFIFGCGRSGTSLLTRMLDSHPAIGVPYESHLYNRIYPRLRRSADLRDPGTRERVLSTILDTEYLRHWSPRPSLEATLAAVRRPDFHGLVEALLETWAGSRGKARWGEKTPHHTLHWRLIVEGFPDLKILHVVRDGRDVVLSFRSAPFGPKHVYQAALHWMRHVDAAEAARAAIGPTAFRQVRYEDLLTDPEGELRQICDFLGEPYDPAMLAFHRNEVDYPTDTRNEGALRRPVQAGNREKWRTGLSAREVRIFEALAGDRLDRYGYPRAVERPSISAWEATSCSLLEHPPRRLLAMLKNRQGYGHTLESIRLSLVLGFGV